MRALLFISYNYHRIQGIKTTHIHYCLSLCRCEVQDWPRQSFHFGLIKLSLAASSLVSYGACDSSMLHDVLGRIQSLWKPSFRFLSGSNPQFSSASAWLYHRSLPGSITACHLVASRKELNSEKTQALCFKNFTQLTQVYTVLSPVWLTQHQVLFWLLITSALWNIIQFCITNIGVGEKSMLVNLQLQNII